MSMRHQLTNRIERYFPRLILLCADFKINMLSETVDRFETDILHSMSAPVHWVLLRGQAMNVSFRFPNFVQMCSASRSLKNTVTRVAIRFLGTPPRVVAISISWCCLSLKVRTLIIQVLAQCPERTVSTIDLKNFSLIKFFGNNHELTH